MLVRFSGRDSSTVAAALAICVFLCFLCSPVLSYIGSDGICGIQVFAPFTDDEGDPVLGLFDRNFSVGVSNLAAAVLAVDHFNARNAKMVPELGFLGSSCNVQLKIDRVFDTGTESRKANVELLNYMMERSQNNNESMFDLFGALKEFCAIAGPSNEIPERDLAVLAFGAHIPLVSAYSEQMVRDGGGGGMRTSVHPDLLETAWILAGYLRFQGRANYIALLHPLSDSAGQRRSALGMIFESRRIKWMASEYVYEAINRTTSDASWDSIETISRSVRAAIQRIKDTGYRTVIISMPNRDQIQTLREIADAMAEYKMLNGDYFFLFCDFVMPFHMSNETENVAKLVFGSAVVAPLTRDLVEDDNLGGPLRVAWFEQGPDFADRIKALLPKFKAKKSDKNNVEDSFFKPTGNFLQNGPQYGAAFMYDAVMSIGIGACNATKQTDGTISGYDHQEGIRKARFYGASGDVFFGSESLFRTGTRPHQGLMWMAVNYFGTSEDPHVQTPDLLLGLEVNFTDENFTITAVPYGRGNTSWTWFRQSPFIYADGSNFTNRTTAPQLLRTPGNPNYLSQGFRVAGLTLMVLTMVAIVLTCVWVLVCRKHQVLRAAQPAFLYVICFGCLIESSAVVTISYDEGAAWSQTELDRMCRTIPWLLTLGHIITNLALFTKLWRVHKTLQFTRKRVRIPSLLWPMAVMTFAAILILVLWTALDPLTWERIEIDNFSGDSFGRCRLTSSNLPAYLVPLLIVTLGSSWLMIFMAYKTKDVDEMYSESNWILILIVVQLQFILIATPVVIALIDEKSNTSHLVFVFLILSFSWVTLGFIFGPKVVVYIRDVRGITIKPKRGQRVPGGTRVTGLELPNRPPPPPTSAGAAAAKGLGEIQRVTAPATTSREEGHDFCDQYVSTPSSCLEDVVVAAASSRDSIGSDHAAATLVKELAEISGDV